MAGLLPTSSGVYQILCVPTAKFYVGGAVDIRARWHKHRLALRRSIHRNPHLQAAWNHHGEVNFVCSVLELVERGTLLEAEQSWIDKTTCTDPTIGFNIYPLAGSPGQSRARVWHGFVDLEGNEVIITNLFDFCRKNKLDPRSMYRLACGRSELKSYKGWTHLSSVRQRDYVKTYLGFIAPSGDPVGPITNLAAFCREHGLDKTHMLAVAHSRLCSHRGWTYNNGRQRHQKVHREFVSPDGVQTEIADLAKFCRAHGLNPVHMHQVKNGQRRSHKGWTWKANDQ
jgi:hypothetical protein